MGRYKIKCVNIENFIFNSNEVEITSTLGSQRI